ncbi:hypothetical protein BJ508DRAFT_329148 [Ascobolus immersus RN42]|uniref:Uncharacterized protein n=1 Tax=Ascobolus immersus RN42 TaxID=1160509 RepID=A0A3N4HXD6_ASCIM|nr:hypothetical protein BJ508DRAFT_329148 [Ascobolus immersus RN42]
MSKRRNVELLPRLRLQHLFNHQRHHYRKTPSALQPSTTPHFRGLHEVGLIPAGCALGDGSVTFGATTFDNTILRGLHEVGLIPAGCARGDGSATFGATTFDNTILRGLHEVGLIPAGCALGNGSATFGATTFDNTTLPEPS